MKRSADLHTLGSMVECSLLRITIAAAIPTDDIREAFALLEASGVLRKTVVRIR